MNFNNLKVSHRLAIGFGVVLAILVVTATLALARLSSFNQQIEHMANDKVTKVIVANDWLFSLMESARHTRNMLILDEREKVLKEVDNLRKHKKIRAERMEELKKSVETAEEKAALQAVIDARAIYTPHEDDYMKLVEAGTDMVAAKAMLLEKARPTQLVYIAKLREFAQLQATLIERAKEEASASYHHTWNLILGMSIAGILAGAACAVYIARGLLKQLGGEPGHAAEVARQIAEGNLTVAIDTGTNDRTSLLHAMRMMRDDLVRIVTQVRHGTEAIATSSAEIASGSQDLSTRTEEQASSLEETASSMEELASTVKQNAENANEAYRLATAASDIAAKGGEVVSQVVHTMEEINASARKIVDIISVIDGISFQTNILALNAAVEAARAGEQGRGFAVVASEVRNLAQRSATAAKEIKALIGNSVEKVEDGSRLVAQAGDTMQEVVGSVKRVTDIVAEIAEASREQSAGIDQVNQSVGQMDAVTQQNAALVEQAAAASESMQDQAAKLAQAVSVFKLDADRAGAASRAVAVKPVAAATASAQTRLAYRSEPRRAA
jgi:methyl-accepting chemotaxis protein